MCSHVLVDCSLELHRTQTEHEDSLISKTYIFQFVNYYSSLFYIGFFKGRYVSVHVWACTCVCVCVCVRVCLCMCVCVSVVIISK